MITQNENEIIKPKAQIRSYIGRPCKLSKEQIAELRDFIVRKKSCTVKEIKDYIKNRFDVDYSTKEIREILKKLGFVYYPLLRKYTYEEYYYEKVMKKFEMNDIY